MTANLHQPTSRHSNGVLIIMIAASLLAHLLLFGSSLVTWIKPLQLPDSNIISIKLAEKPSPQPPDTQRLGQDNNQGSGNTPQQHQLASQQQAATTDHQPASTQDEPPPAPPAPHIMHQVRSKPAPADVASAEDSPPKPSVTAAILLGQVDSLSSTQRGDTGLRDNAQESGNSNGNGDSTHRYEWSRYQTDWRLRIERIGNLNYPEEARRQNVHGAVTLEVTVAADGRLLKYRVLRSSNHDVLDDAAQHIVQMSAPFSPFPPSLAPQGSKVIVQTFAFTRDNQISSH